MARWNKHREVFERVRIEITCKIMADSKIYKFKATIPESKFFYRIYEIKGDITLYKLHKFLISDLEFAPDQMFAFKGFTKDSKSQSTYGLKNYGSGTVDCVTLEMVLEKGEEILLYIYDIKKAKFLQLAVQEEVEAAPRASYPRVVGEMGRLPSQFSSNKDIDGIDGEKAEGKGVKDEEFEDEDSDEGEM